jgi:roadblock/LC7 domain-containing protein
MDRDLEEDIKNDAIIMAKLQNSTYAQNVYCAMCNMRWQPQEVWSVLRDDYWSCSWRSAGGIVADLRNCNEDYMDW